MLGVGGDFGSMTETLSTSTFCHVINTVNHAML